MCNCCRDLLVLLVVGALTLCGLLTGLAEEFGVSAHQVKHYLTVVRDRIHKQIRKTVSEGVTTTSELAAEMSELFHA